MRPRVIDNGDGTVDVIGHPVWSTGRFFGHGSPKDGDHFTPETLDRIVADMQEVVEEVDPRLYAGHPLHPILKMLARPKGKIRNFRREGNYILADFLRVPKGFWEQIRSDEARFSPDMMVGWASQKTGKRYPWVITGLGALGAVIPANTALPVVGGEYHYFAHARAFSEGGEVRVLRRVDDAVELAQRIARLRRELTQSL